MIKVLYHLLILCLLGHFTSAFLTFYNPIVNLTPLQSSLKPKQTTTIAPITPVVQAKLITTTPVAKATPVVAPAIQAQTTTTTAKTTTPVVQATTTASKTTNTTTSNIASSTTKANTSVELDYKS